MKVRLPEKVKQNDLALLINNFKSTIIVSQVDLTILSFFEISGKKII
jgi:hypothetical protein